MEKIRAIVIGAGFTGVATAHDLAMRGFEVILVDRGPIANATSGRTHGLLHSGARYAMNDHESAIECIEENQTLRKIAPELFELNDGLFIAIDEGDLALGEYFIEGLETCHISFREISPQQALGLEPNINPGLLAAFVVPDATFDPLRLAMAFAATAKTNGARFKLYSEVKDLLFDGKGNVTGVKVWDRLADREREIHADVVINATGAWAGQIASMIGADIPIKPTPGVMVAYDQRLVNRTINRLTKPSDGDIVLPQRRMVVVGTTSYEVEDLNYVPVIAEQVDLMLERGSELVPGIRQAKKRGVYTATRPLVGGGKDARSISRTFKFFDHAETQGVNGLLTITGGKATTMRMMAEKTVDKVCEKFGLDIPSKTKETPLVSYRLYSALPDGETVNE